MGLMPDEVDMLTPYELNIMIAEYNHRLRDVQKAGITSAFYGVYFDRVKSLSSDTLNGILDSIDGKKSQMSDEDIFNAIKTFDKTIGG
jgi:hypothetical protein